MAMIKCSECGRMISDRSSKCVGCGAPVIRPPRTDLPFNLVPDQTPTAPLTQPQLRRRMHLAGITFIVGMLAAAYTAAHPGNQIVATIAALVLICGLCWFVVALVQNVMARRK
jgi:hypothetical protein